MERNKEEGEGEGVTNGGRKLGIEAEQRRKEWGRNGGGRNATKEGNKEKEKWGI